MASPSTARTADDETPRYGEAEERALALWVVLSRAAQAVGALSAADIARSELTVAEFGVLELLHHKGPLLLGEVQKRVLVSSGGVTYIVDRLSERGLIERRACPNDRRARYAALTRKGKALMKQVFPQHAVAIRDAMAGLSPAEQEQAHALLRKMGLAAAAAMGPKAVREG
ncbi:MAG: MarR family transcriptional regulator [Gemmatimonadetes bacterium]|nr:MarR family transcriptional regulator [Gemmatimonadota bacterium]